MKCLAIPSPPWLVRLALGLWIALLVIVAASISRPKKSGRLYPTFTDAGAHFAAGEPLYDKIPEGRDQYRYSPTIAAAFYPWSLLPLTLGGILWRFAQAGLLLWALSRYAGVAVPPVAWAALLLLALPMAGGNINNAQLNPLVYALMLFGIVAFDRHRLWVAAFAVAGATMFKIYPAALGLLFVLIEPRRFPLRFLAALAVGVGLPYLFQNPSYVTGQYGEWAERLSGDDRSDFSAEGGYHDFQKLLRLYGMPIKLSAYRVIEVLAGGAAALFVITGQRSGWDRQRAVHAAASLGFLWCTLFGPATESATYILLAATAGHAVTAIMGRPLWERGLVCSAYFLFVSNTVALWFPPAVSNVWRSFAPQAHGALLLLIWVVWDNARSMERDPLPVDEVPSRE